MLPRTALPVALAISLAALPAFGEPGGLHPLTGPQGAVTCAAFSPDGKTLASGGTDRVVRLYDPQTGATRHQLDGAAGTIRGIAWTQDGRLIAAAAENSPLMAWTVDGRLAWSQKVPVHSFAQAISASPDGKTLAVGYSDGSVRLHDAATGKAGRTLAAGRSPVFAVSWSPDGRLISVANKVALEVWNGQTGKPLREVQVPPSQAVLGVAFAREGKTLAAAHADGKVELWDAAAGVLARILNAQSGAVKSVVFSPEGDIVTGGADGRYRKWSGATGEQAYDASAQTKAINAVAYSPDGRQLATASDDGSLVVWDAYMRKQLFKLKGPSAVVNGVAYLAGLNAVASAGQDGYVTVYDATTGVQRWTVFGHGGPATAVMATPDGRSVFSAGGYESPLPSDTDGSAPPPPTPGFPRRGRIMVWRGDDGQIQSPMGAHAGIVTVLSMSADGRAFVSGTATDGEVLLWDIATAVERFSLHGPEGAVTSLAVGPAGDLVVSGGADGNVRLWNGASAGLRRVMPLGGPVEAVALSPDGLLLATAGGEPAANGDHPIKLWDVSTGNLVRTLDGHHSRIGVITFSQDGWYLLSTSRSVTGSGQPPALKVPAEARLWLVQTGALVKSVAATAGDMKDITSASFAPDIHAIALGCTDQQIWMWNAK